MGETPREPPSVRARAHAQIPLPEESLPSPQPNLRPPLIPTDPKPPPNQSDVDPEAAHIQWVQERIESRLKGEYERAGKHLSDILEENSDSDQLRFRLSGVRVRGAEHTRRGFLKSVVDPFLLDPVNAPTSGSTTRWLRSLFSRGGGDSDGAGGVLPPDSITLRQLLGTTKSLSLRLSQFGIYNSVTPSLVHASLPPLKPGVEPVDLLLDVREASRYFLRTSTDVGDGEGSVQATGRIRNVFGGGEIFEGMFGMGSRTRSEFQARFDSPLFASPFHHLDLSIYGSDRSLAHYANCTERMQGAMTRLRTVSPLGYHELSYEAVQRRICDLGPNASMSIREAAGRNTKSAISHTLIKDSRDDPYFATDGLYYRLFQEYAGLGGDASHFKTTLDGQLSRGLGKGWSLSAGLRSGVLYPLAGKTLFSDRFQLGGPTSLRMFNLNSLGPKDHEDYVGGDLMWAAGLSLLGPIPTRPEWPVKTHLFFNAGRLIGLDGSKPLSSSLPSAFSQPSTSVGLGLMYRHSLLRLEVNVGLPLTASQGDGTRKGLQVGVGMSFL